MTKVARLAAAAVISLSLLVLIGGVLAGEASAREIKVKIKKPNEKTRAGDTAEFKVKIKNRKRSERTVLLEVSLDDDFTELVAEQTITLGGREKRKIVVRFEVPVRYTEKKITVWARAGDGEHDRRFKVKRASKDAVTQSDREEGRELYRANCAACHGETGGDLDEEDFGDWREAIREGEDDMPRMPGFSDDDIRLMRAYVRGTGAGSDADDADWQTGREMYLASCAACHGTRGNDIRGEDLHDWQEAIWEGDDDMPAMSGFSAEDIWQMRIYVLDPDRVVADPSPDPDPDPDPDPITYDGAVKAILQANCTACHRQGLALGSIALDTYASAFANRVAILDSVEKNRMPTSSPLSTADKTTLRNWLDSGAPEK